MSRQGTILEVKDGIVVVVRRRTKSWCTMYGNRFRRFGLARIERWERGVEMVFI
jgi:hypothetical protein